MPHLPYLRNHSHEPPAYPSLATNLIFIHHLQAKTTKKITLRMECKDCKYKLQLSLKRCKHFEIGAPSKHVK